MTETRLSSPLFFQGSGWMGDPQDLTLALSEILEITRPVVSYRVKLNPVAQIHYSLLINDISVWKRSEWLTKPHHRLSSGSNTRLQSKNKEKSPTKEILAQNYRWMRITFSPCWKTPHLPQCIGAKYDGMRLPFDHKEVSNGFNWTVDRQAWSDVDQPVGNERLANKPRFPCLPIEQNGGLLTKQITLRNHPAPTYSLNYPLPTTTTGRDDKPPVRGSEQLPIRHIWRERPDTRTTSSNCNMRLIKIFQTVYK